MEGNVTNNEKVIGVGVIGLGGAAVAMVPKFAVNPKFEVRGAADLDPEILGRLKQDIQKSLKQQ